MTNQQKIKALKAYLKQEAGFIPSSQWLKDNLKNYEFIDGKVYHVLALPKVEPEPIETVDDSEYKYEHGTIVDGEPIPFYDDWDNGLRDIVYEPQLHNHDIAEPIETKEVELNSEQNDHSSEHLNKIEEAVILHHEGIKAFINQYNDVQIIQAFHFQATDRFLIFCKDLKVKKKSKEEFCLYWWDWANRITTRTGDYVDCYLKYRELINLMGNPSPITLPESPDLTEYYRNVTYCPANGKRCEQLTLSLGV